MAFEAYRVNRRFVWDGWQYAPKAGMHQQTFDVLPAGRGKVAKASHPRDSAHFMKGQGCWDERSCDPELYAGDIWIVEENHPRKAAILSRNKAVFDSGLPHIDELLARDEYNRLLSPPSMVARV